MSILIYALHMKYSPVKNCHNLNVLQSLYIYIFHISFVVEMCDCALLTRNLDRFVEKDQDSIFNN